jgi:hypothetical protein
MENHLPFYRSVCMAIWLLVSMPWFAFAEENSTGERVLTAGPLAFSDELGGHTIVSVSGSGSRQDPIVITQKIESVAPSIITIRNIQRFMRDKSLFNSWTSINLKFITRNISAAGWIGFRFELQEKLGTPSIYSDGLSFNQITRSDTDIRSSKFLEHSVEFEPGDRLVFEDGWVDQGETVEFNLLVLDLSPADIFYIVQVPQLPAS